jgi:hypothetical protein
MREVFQKEQFLLKRQLLNIEQRIFRHMATIGRT